MSVPSSELTLLVITEEATPKAAATAANFAAEAKAGGAKEAVAGLVAYPIASAVFEIAFAAFSYPRESINSANCNIANFLKSSNDLICPCAKAV